MRHSTAHNRTQCASNPFQPFEHASLHRYSYERRGEMAQPKLSLSSFDAVIESFRFQCSKIYSSYTVLLYTTARNPILLVPHTRSKSITHFATAPRHPPLPLPLPSSSPYYPHPDSSQTSPGNPHYPLPLSRPRQYYYHYQRPPQHQPQNPLQS